MDSVYSRGGDLWDEWLSHPIMKDNLTTNNADIFFNSIEPQHELIMITMPRPILKIYWQSQERNFFMAIWDSGVFMVYRNAELLIGLKISRKQFHLAILFFSE